MKLFLISIFLLTGCASNSANIQKQLDELEAVNRRQMIELNDLQKQADKLSKKTFACVE